MGLAHWDDVEGHRRAKGEMDATWQRLGDAAGTKGVGLNRVRVAPGKLPTPPHSHGASEEVYFVLGGSGLAWQDDQVHEIRPGDCVIHRANELEHTFVAGPDGLDYLVFGTRHASDFGWLPRSGAVRLGWPWVEGRDGRSVGPRGGGAAARVRRAGRAAAEHPQRRRGRAGALGPDTRGAARDAGALRPGGLRLGAASIPAARGSVPHCHSEEEEIFVMLEGEGTLHLWPSPSFAAGTGAQKEEIPIRAGHVVARPPGTRVSHWFRAGPERADDADLRDAEAERHVPTTRARTRSRGAGSA